jgi:hypothetical protein
VRRRLQSTCGAGDTRYQDAFCARCIERLDELDHGRRLLLKLMCVCLAYRGEQSVNVRAKLRVGYVAPPRIHRASCSRAAWLTLPAPLLEAITLCGLHFSATAAISTINKNATASKVHVPMRGARWLPAAAPQHAVALALTAATCARGAELALFILVADSSVAAMNISLKVNSIGLYQVRWTPLVGLLGRCFCYASSQSPRASQISKLSMIPVTCLLERIAFRREVKLSTALSILFVITGVGIWSVQ